ncbi:MAG: hypothetical protein QM811_12425 [Pirellulales bacterium]
MRSFVLALVASVCCGCGGASDITGKWAESRSDAVIASSEMEVKPDGTYTATVTMTSDGAKKLNREQIVTGGKWTKNDEKTYTLTSNDPRGTPQTGKLLDASTLELSVQGRTEKATLKRK